MSHRLPLLALPFVLLFLSGPTTFGAKRDELDLKKATYAPRPDYPYEARKYRVRGAGIVAINVDPATGRVTRAYMKESTHAPILDEACLRAFSQWRFQPGTVAHMETPITFTVPGTTWRSESLSKKQMDAMLAPYLGKGGLIAGAIPNYPIFGPRIFKKAKGVYELHADARGKVEDVRIVEGSKDQTFDEIAIKALREWVLRNGPRTVKIPLRFKLKPDTFIVEAGH